MKRATGSRGVPARGVALDHGTSTGVTVAGNALANFAIEFCLIAFQS
jgi:hypothetical protein